MMIGTLMFTGLLFAGKTVEYKIGNDTFEGYLATASKKAAITVFVVQDWNGIDDHEKKVCDKLASYGYNAFAIDVYGKGVRPSGVQACSQESGKYYQDSKLYMTRLTQAMKFAPKTAKKVAIGYCFGGTGVLELARRNLGVQGVVSFHGGLKPLAPSAKKINSKVLVLHGDADPFVPKEDVLAANKEFKKAQWYKMVSYAGAVHAFTVPSMGFAVDGAAYDEKADKASWQELLGFLKKV